MCAEMNMIWLHVEASNLKLSGWVWSPCSQERTEKSYHASSLFRLAPPTLSPHLLITYYKSTHCSGLPFPEARAIYLLSLFSGSLGCDPGRLSYLLLDAPWSPHQSPFGSQAAKKKNIQEFFSYVRHWLFQHLSSRPLAVPLPCSLLKPLSVSSYWVIPFIQRVRLPYWQAWVKIVLQPQGTGSFELSDSQNTWCE